MCTTVAASYVTDASQSAGAAAEQAADRKSLKYAELTAAYEFQPHWPATLYQKVKAWPTDENLVEHIVKS